MTNRATAIHHGVGPKRQVDRTEDSLTEKYTVRGMHGLAVDDHRRMDQRRPELGAKLALELVGDSHTDGGRPDTESQCLETVAVRAQIREIADHFTAAIKISELA